MAFAAATVAFVNDWGYLNSSLLSIISGMELIFIPILSFLFFGIITRLLAQRYKRNVIVWPIIGAFLGVSVLYPFRTYKISRLNPELGNNLSNSSIIMSKEIVIPGHPDAYNPSIISYKDGYLLSFRIRYHDIPSYIQKVCNVRTSYLGLVKLNRKLEICSEPYLLDIKSYSDHSSSSAQDARLFTFGEKILLFFNDYGITYDRMCCSLYVAELTENNGKLQPEKRATLLSYENMRSTEKNWIPFSSNDKLYLIYSSEPHLILEPNLQTGQCQEIASTATNSPWKWGEIRGGTPAQLIDGNLLTFFHSSQKVRSSTIFGEKGGRNYAMGAYLFENNVPFAINKITSLPLGTLDDYARNNRRKVVFPAGIAIDDNLIHIVWGKNDEGICITSLDKEKLLASMVPL